jgi:hypothetical protein
MALVFGVAYFIRQGQKLAAETRWARQLEASLLTPALRAAAQASDVTKAVREEITAAAAAADAARQSLDALRQALAAEAQGLGRASEASLDAAQRLSGELGRERGELEALADALDAQASRAAEVVGQQAQRVAEVSERADAQLRAAESGLSAQAAALAAAAAETGQAARAAGEDLARHAARLETAGAGVADQVRAVEGGLSEQRIALVTLAQMLRGDHQAFAADAEAHAARLEQFIGETRRAAAEMSGHAGDAGEVLRSLVGEAAERFAVLSATMRREREAFEETAARHVAAAREQVDQLSEAAFAAGRKANEVFEARLGEARALIDESARMVGEAGAAATRKVDENAAAARAVLDELGGLFETIEARTRDLPADVQLQTEAVRDAVSEGMSALMAEARRTAEQAQAIDAAFQERVRRNFDMMSEAVRMMGAVAAGSSVSGPPVSGPSASGPTAPGPGLAIPPPPEPEAPAASPFAGGEGAKAARPAKAGKAAADPSGEAAAKPGGAALAERLGLRPRLKLTPTATDQALSEVFEAAGKASPPPTPSVSEDEGDDEDAGETWTWKDLLASLGGGETAGPAEATLGAELAKMGVQPEKLLPQSRIDQIAAAMQVGDLEGARQVVKRLAGPASRRIVRGLFTDEGLKAKASEFVHGYQKLVDDAAVRDPEGFLMANLLGCDAGRVFLLLDQALGDVA